jgi:hypothetical protein
MSNFNLLRAALLARDCSFSQAHDKPRQRLPRPTPHSPSPQPPTRMTARNCLAMRLYNMLVNVALPSVRLAEPTRKFLEETFP